MNHLEVANDHELQVAGLQGCRVARFPCPFVTLQLCNFTPRLLRLTALLLGCLCGITAAFYSTPVFAHTSLTPDAPDRGLVYHGLVPEDVDCSPGYRVEGTDFCTHGPDPAPATTNVQRSVQPLITTAGRQSDVACEGDGTSGKRVQVIYARAEDKPDRYNTYLASIRTWAADADAIFEASAVQTGGHRQLRFVTNPDCQIMVASAVVPANGDDSIGLTIAALRRLGFADAMRKYLIFMDAQVYCGISTIERDSSPALTNRSNTLAGYARVDNGCWSGSAAAHELVHTLGGIQHDAPHASGGWHCIDEHDLLCYSDWPYYPATQLVCTDGAQGGLLDCNHDDYYHTNPPADSYLATHWNVANSEFLLIPTTPPNLPPIISILAPTSTTVFTAPAAITIEISVTDADGAITAVEFYNGSTLLASVVTAPYRYTWTGVAAGEYAVTAQVYDDAGATTVSSPLTLVVAAPVEGQGEPPIAINARVYFPLVAR